MRLIDADDLKQVLEAYSEKDSLGHTPVQICDAMPTVDAVEVVRCKDCKHYHTGDKSHPDCDWCNRMICGTIKPGFFCADGERRSE